MLAKELKEEIERQLAEKFSETVIIQNMKPVPGGCINKALKVETNLRALFLKIN